MDPDRAILLVDDQPDFLENVSLTLESAGYRTVTATDGFEAIEALKKHMVSLILSDIGMPEMGGYQFYKRVRNNPTWAAIPFVFLTGYEFLSDNEIGYGRALGVSGYLSKPIRAADLLNVVDEQLHHPQPATRCRQPESGPGG